jgi:hypothetical protein
MVRESDNEWNKDVKETKYCRRLISVVDYAQILINRTAVGTNASLRTCLVISRIPISVMAANKPWTTRGPAI